MKNSTEPPIYSQIAMDIAVRIVRGDLKEKTKISGRSLMASEYKVSPETIRKSFQLLEDMKIIDVLPNSGAIIKSSDEALKYIEKYNIGKDIRTLKNEIKELLEKRDNINRQILKAIDQIIDVSERFRNTNPLYTLEFEIPEFSPVIGKSINETNFWQSTGATIVAVKRNDKIILSPGPYLVFEPYDVIFVTGDTGIPKRVETFISV